MTVNLFGVRGALEKEKEKRERIKKSLKWKLRDFAQTERVIEGSNSVHESDSLPEAQKSNSPS